MSSFSTHDASFLNPHALSRADAYWHNLALKDSAVDDSAWLKSQKRRHARLRKENQRAKQWENILGDNHSLEDSELEDFPQTNLTSSPSLHCIPSPRKNRCSAGQADEDDLPPPIDIGLPSSSHSFSLSSPQLSPLPKVRPPRPSTNINARPLNSESSEDLIIQSSSSSRSRRKYLPSQISDSRAALLHHGGAKFSTTATRGPAASEEQRQRDLLAELEFSDPEPATIPRDDEQVLWNKWRNDLTRPPTAANSRERQAEPIEIDADDFIGEADVSNNPQKAKGKGPLKFKATPSKISKVSKATSSTRSADQTAFSMDAWLKPAPITGQSSQSRLGSSKRAQSSQRIDHGPVIMEDELQSSREGAANGEEGSDDDVLRGPGMLASLSPGKRAMMLSVALGTSNPSTSSDEAPKRGRKRRPDLQDDEQWGFFVKEPRLRETASSRRGRGRGAGRGRGSSKRAYWAKKGKMGK